jgi:hypothetical protein
MPKPKLKPAKLPWYWIKNSQGNKSASITFAFIAFWVTTLMYVFSMFKSCGSLEFREFDTAAVSTYLIPILTLYFGRRWTESKNESSSKELGLDGTGEIEAKNE